MTDDQALISAEVVLRPASGREPTAPPSAANLHEHLPAPEAAERARSWFSGAGLQVGPLVATSFSIAGSVAVFRTVFGVAPEIRQDPRSPSAHVVSAAGSQALPLDAVPPEVRAVIREVAFAPPLDFGPPAP